MIEIDVPIAVPSGIVLGRADCHVTIRRTTPDGRVSLGAYQSGDVEVQNITFDGAGIESNYSLVFADAATNSFMQCNFINCAIDHSAALRVQYGDIYIKDCHFDNNKGGHGTHFLAYATKAVIEDSTFTGGYDDFNGPVYIMTSEETRLIGCTITGNTAGQHGGGVYVGCGTLTVIDSKIYGNTANGVADDIMKAYGANLSLVDNHAALVELYKPDGVIPNKWAVDSCFDDPAQIDSHHADMIFSMTFAGNEPAPVPPVATSITLDKSELTLDIGETAILTATLHPEGRSNGIQWASVDPSVASVTENGLITAHSAGATSIIATTSDGKASASCRVNVQTAPVKTYSIIGIASPEEGGEVRANRQCEEGTILVVQAVPNTGYRFLAWVEGDMQVSTELCYTFTVTSDRTLTAIFEPISEPIPKPTYFINTSATVGGTVSGAGEYEQGSSVTLTATPESGYLFVGWTENNEQISTDESFTFIVDRDRTLAANFAPITQPTYTINTSATVGGTASGGGKYEQGAFVTLTAMPESEYLFIGWTENGEQVSTDESFTFIVEQDRTLVANFEPIPQTFYTVQVSSTQGGKVEGGGSYEKGTYIMVNAVPDNGYRFLYWEEDGEQVIPDANITFMVIRNRTLVAVFEPIPKPVYTIQVSSTQGGGVDGGGSYSEGESVTVTATCDAGYRFLRWEENGVQVSAEARFSFTAETDRTLVAVFDLIPQSTPNWTPTISYVPKGVNVKPVVTSMSVTEEVKKPTLTNGKAVLTAPDDLFWGGYKTGRDNGAGTVTRADLAQLIYSMMDDESKKIYGVTHPPFVM